MRCAISDRNLLQEWNHQSENMGSRSARAPSTSDLLLDVLHDKITCLGRELSESIALLPDKGDRKEVLRYVLGNDEDEGILDLLAAESGGQHALGQQMQNMRVVIREEMRRRTGEDNKG